MTLKEFVSKGWADHAEDAEGVFERLPSAFDLIAEAAELPALAGLIVHVAGEHCGRWADGVALLERVAAHEVFDAEAAQAKAVFRSMAILEFCAGNGDAYEALLVRGRSGPASQVSDRVRVLAIAASALAGQSRTDDAIAAFSEALDLAETKMGEAGPSKDDPAARALAITGNNLACELEEKTDRTPTEGRLMLQAAQAGRRYWELTGTWTNVERAEYRLAMTHLQLGDAASALAAAQACHDVCKANDADAGELFFANEALSKAHGASGAPGAAKQHRDDAAACVEKIEDEGFRSYCAAELAKLDAALA